jgi:predicted metalloprotease with PDZ domain
MYILRSLFFIIFFGLSLKIDAYGQKESKEVSRMTILYSLTVNPDDFSGYNVEMHLRHAPHHFQLAMATHHEYDDRFWRYVQNFSIKTNAGIVRYVKKDSALWDITIQGNRADISYHIQLPNTPRFAQRPFLTANGGLLGDIHSFMYMVRYNRNPCTVRFQFPEDWQIATGLAKTSKTNTFSAHSANELLDCPVLAGRLHQWKFIVKRINYTVAYLPVDDGKLHFDSVSLVNNIRKIVIQTVSLFDGIPYKNYIFLFEDGVNGALEHTNSVTIGAPDTSLAHNMQDTYSEIAHEFSHSWNLMRIKPADYTELNYGPKQCSAELWFSEGMAMFYADLLPRRAGLPVEDKTRLNHLNTLVNRYYADTGNMVVPPEKVSLASNNGPGSLGDYSPSIHLQGELIGSMLDMLIRNSTHGERSFDDVMRLMYKRFGKNKGFYASDVEHAVMDVCQSHAVPTFFKNYVYEGKAIDFAKYLHLIGLQLTLTYQPAVNKKGTPAPDNRIYIWRPADDTVYHLILTTPAGCWAKAGLHTGNVILSINDQPIKTRQIFNDMVNNLKIGDKVVMQVKRADGIQKIVLFLTGYQVPVVQITKIDNAGIPLKRLYNQWEKGN